MSLIQSEFKDYQTKGNFKKKWHKYLNLPEIKKLRKVEIDLSFLEDSLSFLKFLNIDVDYAS